MTPIALLRVLAAAAIVATLALPGTSVAIPNCQDDPPPEECFPPEPTLTGDA